MATDALIIPICYVHSPLDSKGDIHRSKIGVGCTREEQFAANFEASSIRLYFERPHFPWTGVSMDERSTHRLTEVITLNKHLSDGRTKSSDLDGWDNSWLLNVPVGIGDGQTGLPPCSVDSPMSPTVVPPLQRPVQPTHLTPVVIVAAEPRMPLTVDGHFERIFQIPGDDLQFRTIHLAANHSPGIVSNSHAVGPGHVKTEVTHGHVKSVVRAKCQAMERLIIIESPESNQQLPWRAIGTQVPVLVFKDVEVRSLGDVNSVASNRE